MVTPLDPRNNRLLYALPSGDLQRWLPLLEWVKMPRGLVLYEQGSPPTHAYFPATALVALLYVMESGASSEIAVVGSEGMVGVSLFMGGGATPSRAVVQCAGEGFRIPSRAIRHEFEQFPAVMGLLLRFTQALIAQMTQTAACNRHHLLHQQLCRLLLLSLDRMPGQDLPMTQELISNMLGVRREGVTEAALNLQKAGLIRYARGHIAVLDRAGLERRTCECYAVVKREYDRLLPETLFMDAESRLPSQRPNPGGFQGYQRV
jgi:CRP-like cAMP-binding protein